MTAIRFDPDELARLEEERDFLLRSLDDLEAERADGNIDDDEYERLKDDYTARAAAVLRTIRDGLDTRPVAPPSSGRRKFVVAAGVVAFAVLAGGLLARSLGERLPGQTVTGNSQLAGGQSAEPTGICPASTGTPEDGELEELAARADDSPAERLVYAGSLWQAGKPVDALAQYDAVAEAVPDDAESVVCGAQILFAAGLVDEGLARLDGAVARDPDFAPTYYFRGLFRYQADRDADAAVQDLERSLELDPDGPFAEQARVAIEEISSAGERQTVRETDGETPDQEES